MSGAEEDDAATIKRRGSDAPSTTADSRVRSGPRVDSDRSVSGGALEETTIDESGPEESRPKSSGAPSGADPSTSDTLQSRLARPRERAAGVGALDATVAADPSRGPFAPAPVSPLAQSPAPTSSFRGARSLRAFGPYSRVEALAEQGNMGLVARAYNDEFGRWELLKFLKPDSAGDIELLRQFKREGRVLAKLSHPNVVSVFATYELDGSPCFAMEFLEGQALGAHVKSQSKAFTVARCTELMLEAARGLAAAHEVGLLHRDIKPDNLFVTGGGKGKRAGLQLIDFGLATADRARPDSIEDDPALASDATGGTPLYMAPELWSGHDASPRSDLYSLGMTIYFVLTGEYPFTDLTMRGLTDYARSSDPPPSLASKRDDVPAPLVAIVDRLIVKDPAARFASADDLVAALIAAEAATRPRKVPGAGPYRGLEPFTAAERDVFFGRDREVAEITERLRAQSAAVLVGPSGSGKSSLAHAGVVPAIEEGVLGGGVLYRSIRVEPRLRPIRSLASALAPFAQNGEEDLVGFLRREPARLGETLRASLGASAGLLLVVDQLEELATVAEDPAQAHDFATALGSLIDGAIPNIRVLATLRADLMDRLFGFESLRHLLTRGFYPVRPLAGDALKLALVEPAKAAGFKLEDPGIAQSIVDDVGRTRAGLPLMSFAMASWWQARDEQRSILPTEAWRELGGLAGALVRHADGVLDGLGPAERESAERILTRLVTAEGTRQHVQRDTLVDPVATGPAAARALDRLLSAKLLVETSGEVELVHDALVDQWPRLGKLLAESGKDREYRERIATAAKNWEAQGRPHGSLWDGDQAVELIRWFGEGDVDVGQDELPFIEAVRDRVRRRRFVVRTAVVGGVLVAVVLALVTKASERKMAAELESTRTSAEAAQKAHAEVSAALLKTIAGLEVERDPAAALRALHQSRDLKRDPSLDPIGWRAKHAGVAVAVPLHSGGTELVRMSREGGWTATAGASGRVHVLETEGDFYTAIAAPAGKGGRPTAMQFAPSGKALAFGNDRGVVVLAEAPKFTTSVLAQCEGAVSDLAWHGADRVVFRCSKGADADVRALSVSLKSREHTELWAGPVDAMDVAVDGSVLAMATDGKLRLVEGPTGASLGDAKLGDAKVSSVAVSRDAARVLVATADGRIADGGLLDGKLTLRAWRQSAHTSAVRAVAVSPTGEHAASLGADGRALLYGDDLKSVGAVDVSAPVLRWVPSHRSVLVAGAGNALLLISVDNGRLLGRFAGSTDTLQSVSTDGAWVTTAALDGGVRAWSLTGAAARVVHGPRADGAMCRVSSDGTTIGCVSAGQLSLERVTASSKRSAPRLVEAPADATPPQATVVGMAVAPGGKAASWQCADGRVAWLFGDKLALEQRGADPAPLLAAAPSGQWLFRSWTDAGKRYLEARNGAAPGAPRSWPTELTAIALAGETRRAAFAEPGRVTLRDFASDPGGVEASPPIELETKRGATALALTDDVTRVAIGGESGVIHVAKVGSRDATEVHRAASRITCLAWTRSGRALVAGTAAGKVLVVDGDTRTAVPLFDAGSSVDSCARRPSDDGFVLVASSGMGFVRFVDTDPVWLSAPPEDPLDPSTKPLQAWHGMAPEQSQ